MDRIENAINNLLIKPNEALKSRIEEVRYCIDIPDTNSKGYCYCLKVDANGTLRLKDLIDYLDTRIVDYAIPKKEIDETHKVLERPLFTMPTAVRNAAFLCDFCTILE